MGSSNPIKKLKENTDDLYNSIKEKPQKLLTYPLTFGLEGVYDTAVRTREDMRDQAAGMAQKDQERAAAAEARAVDASVKDLDPIALERRRRAAVATNQGRSGTILTSGTSLGSADVARKTLLGM